MLRDQTESAGFKIAAVECEGIGGDVGDYIGSDRGDVTRAGQSQIGDPVKEERCLDLCISMFA